MARAAPIDPGLDQAKARHRAGDLAAAEPLYRQVLQRHPEHLEALYLLGVLYLEARRPDAAVAPLTRAVALDPDHADATAALGSALLALGRLRPAAEHLRRAVDLAPRHARAWGALAQAERKLGHPDEAAACLERQVALEPGNAGALANLGLMYREMEDWTEAEDAYDRALAASPGYRPAVAGKGVARNERGDHEAAYRYLKPLVEADYDDGLAVVAFIQATRNLGRPEEGLIAGRRAIARTGLKDTQRQALLFQLGHLHDGLGAYDDAFDCFCRGNDLAARAYGPDPFPEQVERAVAFFDAARFADLPRAPADSALPVFIVGMPRSGTSLVEQILQSHPRVAAGGELDFVHLLAVDLDQEAAPDSGYPECLARLRPEALGGHAREYLERLAEIGPGADRVTDKLPHNFFHLGLIALLFPGARVVHCRRDPVDTCLSCYFQNFRTGHGYATDLTRLGRHYRAYLRIMAHWRRVLPLPMKEVRYEDLVADPEPVVRDLLAFCDLPWDPQCLAFHRSRRVVRTASRDQVRKPIYQTSVARWRHYERHLGPLLAALGDAAPASGDAT